MSMDMLIEKIINTKNPTVVGLDPKIEFVPKFIIDKYISKYSDVLEFAANAIFEFNKGIIDSICDIVPAIKPQVAYYEMYGYHGVQALAKTINYAKDKGLFVIVDGKRNDIGTTMEAYATAYLGEILINGEKVRPFKGDSLTVNGYLGSDGIFPLLDICKEYDKSIFVLVKTSNPSSGELQDQKISDKYVYSLMGELCENWGASTIGKYGYSKVGAVVGATYPQQLKILREEMSHTMFLIPGFGAQGGLASDVALGFDKNGLGAIVNSSRGIICAYQNSKYNDSDYQLAARDASIKMRDDILSFINLK